MIRLTLKAQQSLPVTRDSNNSGYNREFVTQPTQVSHSPGKFKYWIWRLDFFIKLMFLVVLSNIF